MTDTAVTLTPEQADALALVEHPDPSLEGDRLVVLPGSAAVLHRAVQRELRLAGRRDLYGCHLLDFLKRASKKQGRTRLHPAFAASLHAMAAAFPDSKIGLHLLGNRFMIDSEDRFRASRAAAPTA